MTLRLRSGARWTQKMDSEDGLGNGSITDESTNPRDRVVFPDFPPS